MLFENENVEFKSCFSETIYKEVVAFVNSGGGVVYIGVDDTGTPVGLKELDDVYTRVTNGIRDAIMPDAAMFIQYSVLKNNIIRISAAEGTNKPYYLKSKGLRPSGVYVRQGASSVQASPEQIRQMIKENDGDCFEEARSLDQELSFAAAEHVFKQCEVEFSSEKYLALGITRSGIYTNLGLLLSDQCRHTVKTAVFNDESCTQFRDNREFGGSILKQLEDVSSYLSLCNKTNSKINGLYRSDRKDYPEEAVREALINAIVHRDYSYSGSIIININDKKAEFISIGGLLPGLTAEDIRLGISQPRNKKLADVFHRLRLIESYGTGIRRIFKLYEGCPVQPYIETTGNAFKIVLPNMNETSSEQTAQDINPQMRKVLEYLSEKGEATDEELEMLLKVKRSRIYAVTKEMSDQNLISISGRGKDKRYCPK